MTNEEYIWNYFKGKIGNEYGVAGLMGNLQAESGMCPYRLQGDFTDGYSTSVAYTANVDSGVISKDDFVYNGPNGGGYGLAQWTFWSRKKLLYEWYKEGYSSIGSIELACDYLWYELGTYGLRETLKNASSIRQASDVILHDFENPADQSTAVEELRASLGQGWYDKFHGTGGEVDPDVPDVPDPEPERPSGTDSTGPLYPKKKMSLLLLIASAQRKM